MLVFWHSFLSSIPEVLCTRTLSSPYSMLNEASCVEKPNTGIPLSAFPGTSLSIKGTEFKISQMCWGKRRNSVPFLDLQLLLYFPSHCLPYFFRAPQRVTVPHRVPRVGPQGGGKAGRTVIEGAVAKPGVVCCSRWWVPPDGRSHTSTLLWIISCPQPTAWALHAGEALTVLSPPWQCNYTYFKPLETCVQDNHDYHWHDGIKRFFKCPCGNRAIALDRLPKKPCR